MSKDYYRKQSKNIVGYKINESFRFHEDFHRFFPDISMEDIRDSLLTVITGHITIDITQFGRQIEKLYPEEWNRMSITEIVIKHYGKEADDFLNVII